MWRATSKWSTAPAPRRMEGSTVTAPLPPQMVRGKACWPLSAKMQLDPSKFTVLGLKSSF
jgi:hypothetical protein